MKTISKEDFSGFIDSLIRDSGLEVEGVVAKDGKFVFGHLDSASDLRLDYDTTILPPKKYFLPQYEAMIEFDPSRPFSARPLEYRERRVLVGVHPYDIAAISQMDAYFLDSDAPENYLRRRRSTLIIGSDVQNVGERAFFGSMGTGRVDAGYDLFVTDIGDRYIVEIGTDEGEKLLGYASGLSDATPDELRRREMVRGEAAEKATRELKASPGMWHDLLANGHENPVWKENAEKCLACGSCTLVCPTCFCYDVADEMDLGLESGIRLRTWDGCLLRGFTEVAGGEVFREDIVDRYRHRFHRKGEYLPDRFGFVACVGCGRCASQCLPDIADPVSLFNSLYEGCDVVVGDGGLSPVSVPPGADARGSGTAGGFLHLPEPATVKRVVAMTDNEKLFEIELDSGRPLGHQPGQFVEVSVFGTGEAPISVSSAPGGPTFELVVRNVGDVTGKLHALRPGDKVGIRGPFGRGFDPDGLRGRDLLFIAGGLGIVPMRSLFNHVLANRQDYGKVQMLYGCKEPCELLFRDEVAAWDRRDDIEHRLTVDRCPEGECWDGNIGVITTLIPEVEFDPASTVAIVVGPPIMYRFVIADLRKAGMPDENIIVSLERRMKCGVGKCGHCQINGVYVCKEGPVFRLSEIKDLPEAFA